MKPASFLFLSVLSFASVAAAAPDDGFFDLERVVAELPPFRFDLAVLENDLLVGTLEVASEVGVTGRTLRLVEHRQPARGRAAEWRTETLVEHDAEGFARRVVVRRERDAGAAVRTWQRVAGGGLQVTVEAPGFAVDPIYDALVDAGVQPSCSDGRCRVEGRVEGGGVLPDASLVTLLLGQVPEGARWEGWLLSLDDGLPVLGRMQDQGGHAVPTGQRLQVGRQVTVRAGERVWTATHDEGVLLEIVRPDGAVLRPLPVDPEVARAAIGSRAAATRRLLAFLVSWRRGGWSEAARFASFGVDPHAIRDWKVALHTWDGARLPTSQLDVAAAVREAQVAPLAGGGWRFRLPVDLAERLVIDVTTDGGGRKVSDVRLETGDSLQARR